MGLSTPTPIAFSPLSTYIRAPVIAEASGDARNAAVFPTSSVHWFSKFRYEKIALLVPNLTHCLIRKLVLDLSKEQIDPIIQLFPNYRNHASIKMQCPCMHNFLKIGCVFQLC